MSTAKFNAHFDFEPNLNISRDYFLKSDNPDNLLRLTTIMDSGPEDLTKYVILEPEYVVERGGLRWILQLPENLKSGFYHLRVCAFEGASGGFVGAIGGACDLIYIRVLYPGKLLSYGLSVTSVDLADEFIEFRLSLVNDGKEKIENVQGFIYIYDILGKQVKTIETDLISLNGGERDTLNTHLLTQELEAGNYLAEARIYWDGNENITRTNFTVGSAQLKIIDITTEYIVGEINPINLTVRNGFKGGVTGAYIVLNIANSEIRLPSFDMQPYEEKNFVAYWNTKKLEEGIYKVEASLFSDKQYKQNFNFELKSNDSNFKIYIGVGFGIFALAVGILIFLLIRRKNYEEEV